MPELGPYGSVRGAVGNSRPYREHSPQWLSHTFKISLQMRESRVDQFLIKVNFIGLMR